MNQVQIGQVISVGSPVQVRMVGDSSDTPCPFAADGVAATLGTGDKVLLNFTGGQWIIVALLEAT